MFDAKSKIKESNDILEKSGSCVKIYIKNNRFWLRGTLPSKPWINPEGLPYQQFISLGSKAQLTENGLKFSMQQAAIVNGQLLKNTFNWEDWVNSKKFNDTNDLKILFQKYFEYKKSFLSDNTVKTKLISILNYVNNLEHSNIEDAVKIKNSLLKTKSLNSTKQILLELSRCCEYFIEQKLLKDNPFKSLAESIKVTKQYPDIKPFSKLERDLIIKAFSESKHFKRYTFLVQFLFFTGCRPSEAIALRWKNITSDYIIFENVFTRSKTIKSSLKTQKSRKFPINKQLSEIIEKHRKDPEQYVFTNKSGNILCFIYFNQHIWSKILNKLVIQGLISEYRKPYCCRHTFITLCLEQGVNVKDVAGWVGNSPQTIYKHYAGFDKNLKVPSL